MMLEVLLTSTALMSTISYARKKVRIANRVENPEQRGLCSVLAMLSRKRGNFDPCRIQSLYSNPRTYIRIAILIPGTDLRATCPEGLRTNA